MKDLNLPLEPRRVVEVRSRNLLYGVWVAEGYPYQPAELPLFVGIRQKFHSRYLSMEYGWAVIRVLDDVVPDSILIRESLENDDDDLVANEPLFDFLQAIEDREDEAGRTT